MCPEQPFLLSPRFGLSEIGRWPAGVFLSLKAHFDSCGCDPPEPLETIAFSPSCPLLLKIHTVFSGLA